MHACGEHSVARLLYKMHAAGGTGMEEGRMIFHGTVAHDCKRKVGERLRQYGVQGAPGVAFLVV